jgi:hypothetical protein
MLIRKGKKGLYYEDDVLCNNYYNDYNANIFQLMIRYIRRQIKYDISTIIKGIIEGLQYFIHLLLLPILPLLYAIHVKLTVRKMNIKKEMFQQDYFEVLDDE